MHLGHAHALPFIADDLVINYDDKRSHAAIEALGELSRKTQVLFLTHHDLELTRFCGHPQTRETARGVFHGTKEAKSFYS
jgi:uncharacterized protein YhaN